MMHSLKHSTNSSLTRYSRIVQTMLYFVSPSFSPVPLSPAHVSPLTVPFLLERVGYFLNLSLKMVGEPFSISWIPDVLGGILVQHLV